MGTHARRGGGPHGGARLATELAAALECARPAARRPQDALGSGPARPNGSPSQGVAGLSRREAEILRLLAVGGSNHQIARALDLSPRTVQRHVANIYLKIGAHNKANAAAYALRHRLV